MGASILGIGSNLLIVEGCDLLQGAEFTLSTDYVEVASVAAICALTGGRAQIEGVPPELMRMIARVYGQLGLTLELDDEQVFIPRVEKLIMSDREEDVDLSLESAPWPGFPSDLIAMATVVATQSRGTALIHEKLFSNRLLFVDKLKAMGAQIVLADPHRAIVVGPTPLRSIYMDTPDVRTGMAMLGAALVAEGTSTIDNAEALEQSFGAVLGKLHGLGARITVE
jgi:UDP-N-acetylglucosamine 1-carboxyvinyltransferase